MYMLTINGIDCSGKTTLVSGLTKKLDNNGIILAPHVKTFSNISIPKRQMLYATGKSEEFESFMVEEVVARREYLLKVSKNGHPIIVDRGDSTLLAYIMAKSSLDQKITYRDTFSRLKKHLAPMCTTLDIFLHIPHDIALKRANKKGEHWAEGFISLTRNGIDALAFVERKSNTKTIIIDGTQSAEEVLVDAINGIKLFVRNR